jgi:hypothetical protein
MKVASLYSFRESQLLKSASREDLQIYGEMRKLAEVGATLQLRMLLAQHPEMEKDAGIVGHGFRLLSKALGKAGTTTGSSGLTQMAGQAAKASQKRFATAATTAQGRVVAMEEGLKGSSRGRLVNQMGKADKYQGLAKQQGQWAKTHGQTAGKQIATARAPAPVVPSPLISKSTLGKAVAGTAVLGTGAVGAVGASKAYREGQQQNAQAAQRGFNYGL